MSELEVVEVDADLEDLTPFIASIHAGCRPIHTANLPTRFPEDPFFGMSKSSAFFLFTSSPQ